MLSAHTTLNSVMCFASLLFHQFINLLMEFYDWIQDGLKSLHGFCYLRKWSENLKLSHKD